MIRGQLEHLNLVSIPSTSERHLLQLKNHQLVSSSTLRIVKVQYIFFYITMILNKINN